VSDILTYITSDGTLREKEYTPHDSTIDLSNLDIHHFDVSQLATNNQLRKLQLDGNNIARLDITPLIECKKLGTLILDGETDVDTILSYDTIEDVAKEVVCDAVDEYDALSYLPSLNSISASYMYVRKYESDWKMIHLFQNSLRVVGFGWMGMLDIDLKKSEQILKQLLNSGNSHEIQNELISLLIGKINNGDPTIDLDIEMMKHHGDLVMLIDDVVEQRMDEMKNQVIPVMTFPIDKESILLLESVGESVDTHYVDLRTLLLTAYGYELIESLSMGTTCEMRKFSKIQDALSSLGFDVKTNLDPRPYPIIGWKNRKVLQEQGIESPEPVIELPKQLSYEMMVYIWELAEFRSNASMTLIAASSDDTIKIDLSRLE